MKHHFPLVKLTGLAAIALLAIPSITKADVQDRVYDFTDAYYMQNGVDPALIDGRRQVGPLAAYDKPIFPYQRAVRALLTLPAYDHSGNAWYFSIMGGLNGSAFTGNSAGQQARQIADTSPEYIFPRRGTDPMGLGALRQSVLLDMRHGYFSNNKLGLWIHTWVSYTTAGLTSPEGRRMQSDMIQRNGRDLDGNAIIATVNEIEDLYRKGFITKTVRPLNDPLRYAICPVIKDPTDGGIARDQFLSYTRNLDGSALEREFLENFNNLQQSGRAAR
jgi:hypothetical protein